MGDGDDGDGADLAEVSPGWSCQCRACHGWLPSEMCRRREQDAPVQTGLMAQPDKHDPTCRQGISGTIHGHIGGMALGWHDVRDGCRLPIRMCAERCRRPLQLL